MTAKLSPKETLRVEDPEAVAALTDPRSLRYLGPFMGRERTVSEAAKELGVRTNSLLYRVRRFVQLGLLEVARLAPRRGRTVRYYRTSAGAFFVPFEATPALTPEALFARWDGFWQPLFVRSLLAATPEARRAWGFVVAPNARGAVTVYPGPELGVPPDPRDPEGPATLSSWLTGIRLDFHDAKAFQRELLELIGRYLGKEGSQRYLFRIGLAPLPEDEPVPPMAVI